MQQLAQMYGIQNNAQEMQLKQSMAEPQMAQMGAQTANLTAQTHYQDLVNAGYPEHIAAIVAAQKAATEHTGAETTGLHQQQEAFPEQNVSNLALQNAQTQHIGEQTHGLNLTNADLPYHLSLQNRQGEAALSGDALHQEMQRMQNDWFPTNQQQQFDEHQFDMHDLNPMKLRLGNEQIRSSQANDALKLFTMNGLTLPQAQFASQGPDTVNDLKKTYAEQEATRATGRALDASQQAHTATSYDSGPGQFILDTFTNPKNATTTPATPKPGVNPFQWFFKTDSSRELPGARTRRLLSQQQAQP